MKESDQDGASWSRIGMEGYTGFRSVERVNNKKRRRRHLEPLRKKARLLSRNMAALPITPEFNSATGDS
jgi:hypothetical protein